MVPIRHYTLPAEIAARCGAVVSASTLGVARSADALLRHAQEEARAIVDAAHAQAAASRTAARVETQREVWAQAQALLQQLAQARADVLCEVAEHLAELSRHVLQRLLLDIPPPQRLLSSARLVLQEALPGHPVELRVHPGQRDTLGPLLAGSQGLQVVEDESVARDTVVMRMDGIEWAAGFEDNVQCLLEAVAAPDGAC